MIGGAYHRTAEQLQRTRRLRDEIFAAQVEGFGEPALDMTLALFVAGIEDRAVPRVDVVKAAGIGQSAGVIWLRWILERGLAVEAADGIALTERGHRLLVEFLDREAFDRAKDDVSVGGAGA